ncbi:hypothetical protein MKEN_00396000 [Mycena kentingensis (nom. inval.)]|nr:hypothetical protein MKEN_00396000 [Mycena kentingensis (nom. inval.)]
MSILAVPPELIHAIVSNFRNAEPWILRELSLSHSIFREPAQHMLFSTFVVAFLRQNHPHWQTADQLLKRLSEQDGRFKRYVDHVVLDINRYKCPVEDEYVGADWDELDPVELKDAVMEVLRALPHATSVTLRAGAPLSYPFARDRLDFFLAFLAWREETGAPIHDLTINNLNDMPLAALHRILRSSPNVRIRYSRETGHGWPEDARLSGGGPAPRSLELLEAASVAPHFQNPAFRESLRSLRAYSCTSPSADLCASSAETLEYLAVHFDSLSGMHGLGGIVPANLHFASLSELNITAYWAPAYYDNLIYRFPLADWLASTSSPRLQSVIIHIRWDRQDKAPRSIAHTRQSLADFAHRLDTARHSLRFLWQFEFELGAHPEEFRESVLSAIRSAMPVADRDGLLRCRVVQYEERCGRCYSYLCMCSMAY